MAPSGQTVTDPLAAALMRQAFAPRRIDHPLQGAAQMAQAYVARKRLDDAEAKQKAQTEADAVELGRLLMPQQGPSTIPAELPTGVQPITPIPQPGGESSTIPFDVGGAPSAPIPMPDPVAAVGNGAAPQRAPAAAAGPNQIIGAMLQSSNPRIKAQGVQLALAHALDPKLRQKGFTLSPGQTRYGPGGNVIASADPESDVLSEDAMKQKLELARARKSSTNVNVNTVRPNARPLTEAEATAFGIDPKRRHEYIFDGKGDLKQRATSKNTQTDDDIARFNKRAVTAVEAAQAAVAAFRKDKTSRAKYAQAKQAILAVGPAAAQARNVRGEPGDALISGVLDNIPGLLTDAAATAVGGESALDATLNQLAGEFAIEPKSASSGNALTDAERKELEELERRFGSATQ